MDLQKVQNRALRWVHSAHMIDDRPTTEFLHARYRVEPLNIRLHHLARRVWERLEDSQDPNLNRIHQCEAVLDDGGWRRGLRGNPEHSWWPRSRLRALGPAPRPFYTKLDITRLRRMNL